MYKNLIDTHAHVLKEMYKEKRDDIIQLTKDKGVEVINVGINLETSIECVEIAKEHKNYYATIGVHPVDAEEVNDDVFPKLKKLYLENKDVVVGIGETGLDNKYVKDIEKQKDMFIKHIELAKELNLPIIIHNREAFEEVKPIIDKYKDVNFLMHSWTGNPEQAKKYMAPNMWFSFSGIVTFNSAKYVADCLEVIPIDKMLIETDCPWLSPEPHRGKENDPTKTYHVAEFIAKRLNKEVQEILDITYNNANKLFKFK